MSGRDKDGTTSHQPLLSSLVVRASESGGGVGGDYEAGEVRRGDRPPYSVFDHHAIIAWYKNFGLGEANAECVLDYGYRVTAGSVSPLRHRDRDRDRNHRLSPVFERPGAASRYHGNGRERSRHRDYSPPYGRGRLANRGYDRTHHVTGLVRNDVMPRNNPNVQPREGDWICSDPLCKNLNFARRENCNKCSKPRHGPYSNPRRAYPGPEFPPRQRVLGGSPLDFSPPPPRRFNNRSPPLRNWSRDSSRAFGGQPPPPRHGGRFLDPPPRGGRRDYHPDDNGDHQYRMDLARGEWTRDDYLNNERRGYGRRGLSPPPPHSRDLASPPHTRVRSRSPIRGGLALPKDYHPHDAYIDRRGGVGREAF